MLRDLLHQPFNLLLSFFDIRPEERHATRLLLIHSCFVGISMAFFFTPANALFLAEFGTDLIPHGYMMAAVAGAVIGMIYSRMGRILSFSNTLIVNLSFLLGAVLFFWIGLVWSHASWLSLGLYILITPFVSLINIEFWGLAGRLLHLRQAKRLYGLIGAGEVVAGLLAFFTIPLIVNYIGTINLLLLSAGGLLSSLLLLIHINRQFLSQTASPQEKNMADRPVDVKVTRSLKSRYLRLIFNVMILSTFGLYFLHYFFLDQAYAHYPDADRLAAFFGYFYGTVKLVELLLKSIVSGRLLTRYGLKAGLVILPAFLTIGILATAIAGTLTGIGNPFFYLIVATKLMDRTGRLSIFDPTFRVLYQPLKADERISFQTQLEGIYQPLVSGVAGGILLFIGQVPTFTLVHFSYLLSILMLAWIIGSIWLSREYPVALSQAIAKRILSGENTDLSLNDASSLTVLRRSLDSSSPGEVIFSLDLLEKNNAERMKKSYHKLLQHPSPLVRKDVLERIERFPSPKIYKTVANIAKSDVSIDVRGKALRTLCTFDDTQVLEMVSEHLLDPNPHLRKYALLGLLQNPATGRASMAEKTLIEMANSESIEDRKIAALVLGKVRMNDFGELLLRLLRDEDLSVRRAAIDAAGKIGDSQFCTSLMEILTGRPLRCNARSALAAIGEPALLYLEQTFKFQDTPLQTRIQILQICGRIAGKQGLKILLDEINYPSQVIRAHILDELRNCRYQAPNADIRTVQDQIYREAAHAVWKVAVRGDLGEHEAVAALKNALDSEIKRNRYNIFLLLSFIHTPETMLKAYDAINKGSKDKQSYAYELIDVTIAPETKSVLFPLFQSMDSNSGRLSDNLLDKFPQVKLDRTQRLKELLNLTEADIFPWTRACAIYATTKLYETKWLQEWESNLENEHLVVRETAAWALSKLHPQRIAQIIQRSLNERETAIGGAIKNTFDKTIGDTKMLLTIEKVMLLKTVKIFAPLSEEILMDIAANLEEVEFVSGEKIIQKGQIGNCMYIVASGKVKVHDGDRIIAELGEKEIVGEMALLDAEPRMASVTAMEPSKLLRLDQDVFYELMSDYVDVAKGIIKVLVKRLRAQ